MMLGIVEVLGQGKGNGGGGVVEPVREGREQKENDLVKHLTFCL